MRIANKNDIVELSKSRNLQKRDDLIMKIEL